jgi:hypothetical protein
VPPICERIDTYGDHSEADTAVRDPSLRVGPPLIAFTDHYDVFSHLSAKWSAN